MLLLRNTDKGKNLQDDYYPFLTDKSVCKVRQDPD